MANRINDFPKTVREEIAKRAGYLCSNPKCRVLTIGPDPQAKEKSIKKGEAAHIRGASKNSPRHDPTYKDVKEIENALWLCSNCADIIDKNNGVHFSVGLLLEWKEKHEILIYNSIVTQQSAFNTKDEMIVKKLVVFLEDRGMLFMDEGYERYNYVIDSTKEIRTFLTSLASADISQELGSTISNLNNAFRNFMNTSGDQKYFSHLENFRTQVRVFLKDMEANYHFQTREPLCYIIPKN